MKRPSSLVCPCLKRSFQAAELHRINCPWGGQRGRRPRRRTPPQGQFIPCGRRNEGTAKREARTAKKAKRRACRTASKKAGRADRLAARRRVWRIAKTDTKPVDRQIGKTVFAHTWAPRVSAGRETGENSKKTVKKNRRAVARRFFRFFCYVRVFHITFL